MRKVLKFLLTTISIGLVLFVVLYISLAFTGKKERNGTVHIKNHQNQFVLYKENKEFHIRGAAGEHYFKELAHIGGNTIRVYDTVRLKQTLTEAEKHGVSVIVDIPISRYNREYDPYQSQEHNEKLKNQIRLFVREYKNFPALLFWNLGNEVEYPLRLFKNRFIKTFNELIDIIHEEDVNHLVSTSINSTSRKQTLGIFLHSPRIDLIGFNVFGSLKEVKPLISRISLLTNRRLPYYISEWGVNGPWEEENTLWESPIEPTSTQKGKIVISRFQDFIETDKQSLGSLVFYWGQKQEQTHTWFNVFDEEGRKSQIYFDLQKVWKPNQTSKTKIPNLKYMLLEGKGSRDNLVFSPGKVKAAKILFEEKPDSSFSYHWEIFPEAWYYKEWDVEKKPAKTNTYFFGNNKSETKFVTPKEEGPYRLFVKVYHKHKTYATANTPFYILNPQHERK